MFSRTEDVAIGPGRGVLVGISGLAAKALDVARRTMGKMLIQVARNAAMGGQSPRSPWVFIWRLK